MGRPVLYVYVMHVETVVLLSKKKQLKKAENFKK